MLPGPEVKVRKGDQLLFCGRREARDRMDWTLQDIHTLRYLVTGDDFPEGWLWRWIARKRGYPVPNRDCTGQPARRRTG